MSTTPETTALYEDAMLLSKRAMAGKLYAVAYHALAAAMHAAIVLEDARRLGDVITVAEEQRTWINTHEPEHALSDTSVRRRGSQSLWESAEREAGTHLDMLKQRRRIESMHARNAPPSEENENTGDSEKPQGSKGDGQSNPPTSTS